MMTPYREPTLIPPIPEHDNSFWRAMGEAPGGGAVLAIMSSAIATCVAGYWLEEHIGGDVLVAVVELECAVVLFLFNAIWAAVHRRRLREQWLAEALADERAIAAIERGDTPLNE
jgi:uncharacterized membrane protein